MICGNEPSTLFKRAVGWLICGKEPWILFKRAVGWLIGGKEPWILFKRAVGWLICGKVTRVKACYGVSPPCVCGVYIYARVCVYFGVCVCVYFGVCVQMSVCANDICTHTPKYTFAHTLHSPTQSLYFQKCATLLCAFAHTFKNIHLLTHSIPRHNRCTSKNV